MKADEFDRRFDAGEDVTKYLDVAGARRPGQSVKRVNVDLLGGREQGAPAYRRRADAQPQEAERGGV